MIVIRLLEQFKNDTFSSKEEYQKRRILIKSLNNSRKTTTQLNSVINMQENLVNLAVESKEDSRLRFNAS